MSTLSDGIVDALQMRSNYEPNMQIAEGAVKKAFVFSHQRLARGYNTLDVEIANGTWKGREGREVRGAVSDYAKLLPKCAARTQRICRACVGPVIYADILGLHVARYRGVYSKDLAARKQVYGRFRRILIYMDDQGTQQLTTFSQKEQTNI